MNKEDFKKRVNPKYVDENDYGILMSLEDYVNTKDVYFGIVGKEMFPNPDFRIVALSHPLIKGCESIYRCIVNGDCTIDFQDKGATMFRFICVAEVDGTDDTPKVVKVEDNTVHLSHGKYSCTFHLKEEDENTAISFCFDNDARINQDNGEPNVYGEIKLQIENMNIPLPVYVYNITVRDAKTDEVVWRQGKLDICNNIEITNN